VIAGDLTDNGRIEEFQQVAEVLAQSGVPVIAVPGNHDRRCLRRAAMRRTLREAGVLLLDGTGVTVELTRPADGSNESDTVPVRLGLVGVGGYGGGFWPDEPGGGPPIHRVTQAVDLRARREAARLDEALAAADDPVDARLVVMHYAPTATTLGNEPTVKYWMLGNVGLAHVVDRHAVELVLHGHAHLGNPAGETVGGTPVRNVAAHVVGAPVVYELAGRDDAWRPGATVRVGGLTRRGAAGE
jgi:Icc-related predicted phosphoesterase